jgi:hypothetical protein
MTLVVPLQSVPNQVVNFQVDSQDVTLNLYFGPITAEMPVPNLFMDVYANSVLIVAGVVCLQANVIVRDLYLGFLGDFAFYDTQPDPVLGAIDPQSTGLGSRWILVYFAPTELPASGPQ